MDHRNPIKLLPEGTDLEGLLKIDAATKVVSGDMERTADAIARRARAPQQERLVNMPPEKMAKHLVPMIGEHGNLDCKEIKFVVTASKNFRHPFNSDPEFFENGTNVAALDDQTSVLSRIRMECSHNMSFRPDLLRGVINAIAFSEYGIEQLNEGAFEIIHDIVIDSVIEWNGNCDTQT